MIYGQTDVGNVRPLNEDSFYFESTPKGYVMMVADGMGGHNGGEVASQLAVESVREYMAQEDIFSDIVHPIVPAGPRPLRCSALQSNKR